MTAVECCCKSDKHKHKVRLAPAVTNDVKCPGTVSISELPKSHLHRCVLLNYIISVLISLDSATILLATI